MNKRSPASPLSEWHGETIFPGRTHDVTLAISESYSSMTVEIPIRISRAIEDGPTVFVTAALHGDEINGTGAVRHLLLDEDFRLTRGSIILVPVLNLLAFDRHSRYLPDRRDLNRSFPGSASGSLAGRMARTIFEEVVLRCDYGIDLHTAAVRRTNYPNVRGDLSHPKVRQIAEAFGAEIIINGKGPQGSFRREACEAGCPTIIMEGGEVWKVEPGIVETAVRGIKNVLRDLEMLDGELERPEFQVIVQKSSWVRAERGGFLQFHIKPGDIVHEGETLATNTNLLGEEQNKVIAPFTGIVIGMTTLPAVSPGEPICNLGRLPKGTNVARMRKQHSVEGTLEGRVTDELASSLLVVDAPDVSSD